MIAVVLTVVPFESTTPILEAKKFNGVDYLRVVDPDPVGGETWGAIGGQTQDRQQYFKVSYWT